MLNIKDKFKTSPVAKGVLYGSLTIASFFIHSLMGLFILMLMVFGYEYLSERPEEILHSGKSYYYLTVFVLGAISFLYYVYSNLAI